MNYSTAIILMNDKIVAVRGKYEPGGNAEVFKTFDHTLKVDDLVVVESNTRWERTVVKITEVDVEVDHDSNATVRWVIHKVDTQHADELKAFETKAIEIIKKSELRKRREDIKQNVIDAKAAGELEGLGMARLAAPDEASKQA